MDGIMHRTRTATKRKLQVSSPRRITTEQIASLNKALFPQFIKITVLDAFGMYYTGTFYGSTVQSTTQIYDECAGDTYWTDTSFNLIER
nr:MAG TPA: hypothetical protein [Caudoviricetes sp.]